MEEKELLEFKEILLERQKQILKNIDDNTKEIDGLKQAEASDDADHATISADTAIEEALNIKQQKELKEIEYALFKITNKTYGICEMCEDPIGRARLEVKPQAKYCIVCREIVEKRV
jgi:DnaK suppressor protein